MLENMQTRSTHKIASFYFSSTCVIYGLTVVCAILLHVLLDLASSFIVLHVINSDFSFIFVCIFSLSLSLFFISCMRTKAIFQSASHTHTHTHTFGRVSFTFYTDFTLKNKPRQTHFKCLNSVTKVYNPLSSSPGSSARLGWKIGMLISINNISRGPHHNHVYMAYTACKHLLQPNKHFNEAISKKFCQL